jgi:hypothetical protein
MIVVCPNCDELFMAPDGLGQNLCCPFCEQTGTFVERSMPDWDGRPKPVLGIVWNKHPEMSHE